MESQSHTYIAMDLKSFYASVECVDRGLDPLNTNLVVADASRTQKTICLAVSPSLKSYGIPGRARLFEVISKVREVNAMRKVRSPGGRFLGKSTFADELQRHPELEVGFVTATPRMARYLEYSTQIYNIYLKYIAPEDIHVYSIDEVFLDVTLPENLVLQVVSEIHDPVTTTDELIPSGETSSYRSNPLGLAEFTLSRKDPQYVGRAKEIQKAEKERMNGGHPCQAVPVLKDVMGEVKKQYPDASRENTGFGSTIFAVKPGDGSAREQAASCQKVLGGWANIANEYATKRYRSNLINWGMLPFLIQPGDLPFKNLDYLFIPGIKKAVEDKAEEIKAYVVTTGEGMKEFTLKLGELTDEERQIILKGCLINYNRV